MGFRSHLITSLAVTILAACGATPARHVCGPRWQVAESTFGDVRVEDHGLVLTADVPPSGCSDSTCVASEWLSQRQLTGDYSITIELERFEGAAASALSDYDSGSFSASFGGGSGGAVRAWVFGDRLGVEYYPAPEDFGREIVQQARQKVFARSGRIELVRTGETGRVTLTAAGETLSVSGVIGTKPAMLSLGVLTYQPGHPTSARIADVQLIGNQGAERSDTFDCDSVAR